MVMKRVMMFLKVTFLVISFMLVVGELSPNQIVQAQIEFGNGDNVCPTTANCDPDRQGCKCSYTDCRGCFLPNGQTGCGKCSTGN